MHVKSASLRSQLSGCYILAQVPRDWESAVIHRVQAAVAGQLGLGTPVRLALERGNATGGPGNLKWEKH
jgi:hypothetical protein